MKQAALFFLRHARAYVPKLLVLLLACSDNLCNPTRAGEVIYFPMQGTETALQQEQALDCAKHIAQICRAAFNWSMDNAGELPESIELLSMDLQSPAVVFCPSYNRGSLPTNWNDLDWTRIDYSYFPQPGNDPDPLQVLCSCRVHATYGQVDGGVVLGLARGGWPLVTATPMDATASPGATVTLEAQLGPDAILPVVCQWRRAELHFATNVVGKTNSYNPPEVEWETNVAAIYTSTNLPGQMNRTLVLSNVRVADSGYYSITFSNALGVSCSRQCRLQVSPDSIGSGTNATAWANLCATNLQQLWLLARCWSETHSKQIPQSLNEMTNRFDQPMFGWPAALFCPADTNRSAPADWAGVNLDDTSYELCSADPTFAASPLFRCRAHAFYVELGGGVRLGPSINTIKRHPEGGIVLGYTIFAGSENYLEVSGDLQNWVTISGLGSWAGDDSFYDPTPRDPGYYRIRVEH